MSYEIVKIVVIFANSVKHHQHCVAGKDIVTKEWIRPVGDESGCELTHEQAKSTNPYGSFTTKILQKVKIKFLKHTPLINQPENYLISDEPWEQIYKISREEIKYFLDNPTDLWLDNISNNDRVKSLLIEDGTVVVNQSLYLIEVENIRIYYKYDKKLRGKFKYKNIYYDLSITDPMIYQQMRELRDVYLKNKFLCISLGEEYKGYCYKLIASVI